MFDYQQRPTSNEYRDNWERIWGVKRPYCEDYPESGHIICGCVDNNPVHCQWCCENLTDEEINLCVAAGDEDPREIPVNGEDNG